jgi:endonuclease III
VKSVKEARRIFDALERHYPDADTELHYRNAFELLVATILSAQSTDERVNMVTPELFRQYPDARALGQAAPDAIEPVIVSTGFFRQKSRAIIGMSRELVERFHGDVPADMEALVTLPGVGRKTANVVLGHALGVPGLPVDRHVLRVAGRLGLVHSDDPVKVEAALCALYPPERWTKASDLLILHGRRICRPKPNCPSCNARHDCDFFRSGGLVVKVVRARDRKSPPTRPVAKAAKKPSRPRRAAKKR